MNKTILGLAMTVAMSAQAQTSATTAPAAQTTTAPAATAAPVAKSPWSAMFVVESIAGVGNLKKDQSEAKVSQYGSIGAGYQVTQAMKAQLRYNFTNLIVKDRADLGAAKTFTTDDPTIHASIKTPARVLGSEPYTFNARYYIPVSEASQDNNRNGTLRFDNTLTWNLSPKWAVDAYAGVRLYLNQDDPKLGADSRLRTDVGPQVTYNISDSLNVYYMPFVHLVSRGYQRGDWKADLTNKLYQDIGLNWTVGSITLNPYWETGADLNTGKGMGSDATSIYSLVVSGAF